MIRCGFLLPLLLLLLLVDGATNVARGDWTAPAPVSLPVLSYPDTVTDNRIGLVELRLRVLENGHVTDVTVLGANHPAFARDVTAALAGLRFEPARFRGEPRAVTVEFELEFAPPDVVVLPAELAGLVRERGGRRPVVGAEVSWIGGPAGALTDSDGRFTLELPPEAVTVVVAAPGYRPARFPESVSAGERLVVEYLLTPEARSPLELRIEAERERAEISRIRLSTEEVRGVPGTLDDAIRVVQTLPGVNQPSELSGALLVRGSDARDTRVYVDGIDVPFVFHFGALKSIIISDLVQEVVLYPSNFSVRYGDAMGGILDVRLRDPRPEDWGGRVQVGSILSEGVVEGPIGDDTSVQLALRQSYIGELLTPFIPPQIGANFTAIPRFTDYQARVVHRAGRWTFRPFVFGAIDAAELLFDRDRMIDPDNFQRFSIRNTQHNQALRATWSQGAVTGDTLLALSFPGVEIEIGDDEFFELRARRVILRSDWEWRLGRRLGLAGGVDAAFQRDELRARLPRPPRPFEFDYDIFSVERVEVSQTNRTDRGGVYGELRLGAENGVRGALGLRVDYDALSDVSTADPRGLLFVPVPVVGTLKAGLGVYHQFNDGQSAAPPPVGNPDAGPSRAFHAMLGWERSLPWRLEARAEGFYKWFDHLISQNPDPYGVPRWQNWGRGRAWGAELSLRKPLTQDLFGWVSYSYTRSLRQVQADAPESPASFDVPHILNAILNWVPTANWELGGAFRFASGKPQRSVEERLYYGDRGNWVPIFVSEGERQPAFVRLDLRTKYTWLFDRWRMALLLELINATNAANPLAENYNYDYTSRNFVYGVPILPYLALEASF